jgi:hypothetical protein
MANMSHVNHSCSGSCKIPSKKITSLNLCSREKNSVLVQKPERERPLVRHCSRYQDNINMNLLNIKWEGVDRIKLAQDRDK